MKTTEHRAQATAQRLEQEAIRSLRQMRGQILAALRKGLQVTINVEAVALAPLPRPHSLWQAGKTGLGLQMKGVALQTPESDPSPSSPSRV